MWGGRHRGEHRASGRDERQAVRAKSRLAQPQPQPEPILKLSCIVPVRGRAEAESEGQAGHGRSPGVQKGAREGGKNEGVERKGRGQHSGRGGSERREPTGDAGEGPSLRGLAPPPVTVSAPPEHTQ